MLLAGVAGGTTFGLHRHPDPPMQPELLYFRWSHYNEKARWALEFKGIPYQRQTLLPGPHRARARRLTGQTLLPILLIDGVAIHDSTRIVAHLEHAVPEPPLYPREPSLRRRALELENHFDEELGPHIRRSVVAEMLAEPAFFADVFGAEQGPIGRWAYRVLVTLLKKPIGNVFRLDPLAVAASRARVERALDRLESEIQPTGYLVGDRFSIADLTAAAMLSVAVLPDEFPSLPQRSLPPGFEQRVRLPLLDRPAAHWVRSMYQRHRGPTQEHPESMAAAA
jgi:glutathione S-transferase